MKFAQKYILFTHLAAFAAEQRNDNRNNLEITQQLTAAFAAIEHRLNAQIMHQTMQYVHFRMNEIDRNFANEIASLRIQHASAMKRAQSQMNRMRLELDQQVRTNYMLNERIRVLEGEVFGHHNSALLNQISELRHQIVAIQKNLLNLEQRTNRTIDQHVADLCSFTLPPATEQYVMPANRISSPISSGSTNPSTVAAAR